MSDYILKRIDDLDKSISGKIDVLTDKIHNSQMEHVTKKESNLKFFISLTLYFISIGVFKLKDLLNFL
jgi:hypothetical protein